MKKNSFKEFLDNDFKKLFPGVRKKDFYTHMGWSKTTYVERRAMPDKLKLGEIKKMASFFNIPVFKMIDLIS